MLPHLSISLPITPPIALYFISQYSIQQTHTIMETDPGFIAAVEEAKQGAAEGGVPIGACLVSKDGKILGRGHNMRVQKGSPVLHVR